MHQVFLAWKLNDCVFVVCVHPLFRDLQLIYFEFLGNRTRPLFTASPMSRRPNLTTVSPWKYPTATAESPRNWRWVAVFSIFLFFTPSFYQIGAQRSMRTPEHTRHCIHFERAKKTSLPPVLSRVPLLGWINRLLPANSVDDLHFNIASIWCWAFPFPFPPLPIRKLVLNSLHSNLIHWQCYSSLTSHPIDNHSRSQSINQSINWDKSHYKAMNILVALHHN